MISVIVVTRNRPEKLENLLNSILKNSYRNFEIVLLDQSDDVDSRLNKILKKNKKVVYQKLNFKGKSKALNIGINKARGNILAFTDDDCIVDSNWLNNIKSSFTNDALLGAVFGNSFPHKATGQKDQICPSTYNTRVEKLFIKTPRNRFIFLGNNMAIKRTTFDRIGYFKNWLGVGSMGNAAEDEEIVFRILLNKIKVKVLPGIKVQHNRWLNKNEYRMMQYKYSVGFVSAFTYHCLKGEKISGNYLREYILNNGDFGMSKVFNALKKRDLRTSLLYFYELFRDGAIFSLNYFKGFVLGLIIYSKENFIK